MKRNMDLVREILFCIEADADFDSVNEKYGQEVVIGHVELLLDAQLIIGKVYRDLNSASASAYVQRLTWAGHEFLDNARNDTVWNKVISKVGNTVATVSFDVLVELLKGGVLAAIQKV